jgi:hypothetical protein
VISEDHFTFKYNGDVLFDDTYIGRVESDGRLALQEGYRNTVLAVATIEALRVQMHIGGDYEPSGGWRDEHYRLVHDQEHNV